MKNNIEVTTRLSSYLVKSLLLICGLLATGIAAAIIVAACMLVFTHQRKSDFGAWSAWIAVSEEAAR